MWDPGKLFVEARKICEENRYFEFIFLWNPHTFCGIHTRFVESTHVLWNPHTFCGINKSNLSNPQTCCGIHKNFSGN